MRIVIPPFRFRPVPFIATLILVLVGSSLSYWQTQRARQKEAIEAKLKVRENSPSILLPATVDPDQLEYARVTLTGEFIPTWPIYLDNRPMKGIAGKVLLMPFKVQGRQQHVLIARGWMPRNPQDRTAVQPYQTPMGEVQLEGIIKKNSGQVLELGKHTNLKPNALVQNFDIAEFARQSDFPTYPFIIEQTSDTGDGLLRSWPRASQGSDKHRGYAFQWLALAVTALLFFLVTGFKHGSEAAQHKR